MSTSTRLTDRIMKANHWNMAYTLGFRDGQLDKQDKLTVWLLGENGRSLSTRQMRVI